MKAFDKLSIFALSVWAITAQANTYDQLYPYYAELCAVSQIRPLEGEAGGTFGHAVMYLKGVCRDTSRGYPRLRICDHEVDMGNPESGVGISVDRMFKNVNWMAVDGKDMLITGQVNQKSRLTLDVQNELLQRSINLGLYDGIEVHDNYVEKAKAHKGFLDYLGEMSTGTNFGVALGRNAYCARVPIKKDMLPKMVDFLNEQNDKYRGETQYKWSALSDNCTHPIRNALAQVGLVTALKTRAVAPVQALNLAIPANEYLSLLRKGNDKSLKNVLSIYRNRQQRRLLLEEGVLMARHGVVAENFGIHAENEVYDVEKSGILFADVPLLNLNKKRFKKVLREAQYTDVRANLLHYKAKYQEALRAKESIRELQKRDVHGQDEELYTREFQQFHGRYYRYLEESLADVEAKLLQLET